MGIKRICLVIPSLHTGGMERVMSILANQFCNKPNVEVHLVMYGIRPEIFYNLSDSINIHHPDFTFNNNFRFIYSIKTMFYLRSEIKKINPASVLSFGEFWNSFVLLSLFRLKIPVSVSDRCQPDKKLGIVHDILRKILYPHANKVIVQTNTARLIYQKMLPKARISVIGNPLKVIEENYNFEKENIILTVGRLIRSKHHDELIRLFLQIGLPGWKLVIVGGDALKQENLRILKHIINESHAEENVILTNSVKNVDEYYKRSKIFAFTSSSEGFPNVIGEAMSAGLPVVAFNCIAGPSDLIEDGKNGYLIPLFDYTRFREKLRGLMLDETLRNKMGLEAKRVQTRFSANHIADLFYNQILN